MHDQQVGSDGEPALGDRVAKLEAAVAAFETEVRTRCLVVTDHHDAERIVGEVVGSTAEVRMDLPRQTDGERSSVLVFANPGDKRTGLAPGVGVQLWIDGVAVDELTAWAELEW